jgi:RNA polymerase sigma-70 factor (ECF subfamily)
VSTALLVHGRQRTIGRPIRKRERKQAAVADLGVVLGWREMQVRVDPHAGQSSCAARRYRFVRHPLAAAESIGIDSLGLTQIGAHHVGADAEDLEVVARLRAGDERTFEALVERHYGLMLAVAQRHVKSRAVAEEVVQEAWVGVLKGLERFEGRSSLKTWILHIVMNIAKTRGMREARTVPFAALVPEGEEAAIEPERFQSDREPFPGHWRAYPRDWQRLPQDAMLTRETLQVAFRAIDALPETQRTVITMRDVHGYGADEVCAALDISEGNQRVLLHRARSRVRATLERHLDA